MYLVKILASIVFLAAPAWAADDHQMITVTGEGQVEATPDMATMSLGVMTNGDTAQSALGANTAQLTAVLARLKAAGIEGRDIQTSGLSLGRNFDFSNSGQPPKVTGYFASNMVTVRVRALEGLGAVLDSAVADGANTLNDLGFGLQDPAPLMDKARGLAVADARHKAELYAAAAGVGLGKVLSISERAGYGAPMPMQMEMAGGFSKADAVPVASGEVGLTASVTMQFEIRD
ncbi:MAG: SIMPL domain-containing protein [Albidovulum sp.]